MGRARGQTQHGTTVIARAAAPAGMPSHARQLQEALAGLNAALPMEPAFDAYLSGLCDTPKAQRAVVSANGRLYAATDDLFYAQPLAKSASDADRALAQTMTDNAMLYMGRGMATVGAPDSPYLQRFRDGLIAYGARRGPAQLDYLASQGLLPDSVTAEDVDRWKRDAGELYAEAFASKIAMSHNQNKPGMRPVWNAISVLDRVGRARELIERSPAPEPGTHLARAREKALANIDKTVRGAHRYLSDLDGSQGTVDYVTPEGAADATRAEMVAQVFADPATRRLNEQLQAAGVFDRHLAEVNAATDGRDSDSVILAVSDQRYLDQASTYDLHPGAGKVAALNDSQYGILLSPDVARDTLAAGEDGFADVLAHELVHTTQQAKPKGKTLPDQPHPQAARGLVKRHAHFEAQLLEGSTQGLTNHLRAQRDPGFTAEQSPYYPVFAAMVEEAQQTSGIEAGAFYRELNATPTNQRTAYLARTLTGADSEQAQRAVLEPLLNLNQQAELAIGRFAQQTDPADPAAGDFIARKTASVVARHRQMVRSVLAELQAAAGHAPGRQAVAA